MTPRRESQDSAGTVERVLRQLQRWPDWLVLLPLGLLVLAILILAGYSTWITFRTRDLEARAIAVNVPALRSSLDLVVATTLELERLEHYAVTGDTAAILESLENAEARRRAIDRLEPVTPQLTAEPRMHSEDLLRSARRWDTTFPAAADVARLDPASRDETLAENRELLRGMLMYTVSLHSIIRLEVDSARAALNAAERRAWYFTLGLAGLALLASLFVIWLVRRVRRLAEVSRRRRIEVETAMEDRARLIRGITHDLKNPLAAADGNAQLLQMGVIGVLTEGQVTAVRRIRRGVGGALGIVSDMLELSRAESGKLEVVVEPTDVAPILGDATDDYDLRADAAGITLELDVPDALPRALTDGARVRQIIGNLLSNAVKHTPDGGRIRVSAGVSEAPATLLDRRCLAVRVEDTGSGIPPDEQRRIFEEFYRGSISAGGPAGLGLGLAISRRIARLLGGEITVDSEAGRGSVFTLWLPVEEAAGRRHVA